MSAVTEGQRIADFEPVLTSNLWTRVGVDGEPDGSCAQPLTFTIERLEHFPGGRLVVEPRLTFSVHSFEGESPELTFELQPILDPPPAPAPTPEDSP